MENKKIFYKCTLYSEERILRSENILESSPKKAGLRFFNKLGGIQPHQKIKIEEYIEQNWYVFFRKHDKKRHSLIIRQVNDKFHIVYDNKSIAIYSMGEFKNIETIRV